MSAYGECGKGGDSMKEGIIGIIYRHDFNDYEFMISDFSREIENALEDIIAKVDDNDFAGYRGDKKITLEDANIDYFENNAWIQKYVNTEDPNDIVTLPQIFERYLAINGKVDGFEKYVTD